jgi:hypothetical protein
MRNLFFFCLITVFASCTAIHEGTFNEDNSGEIQVMLDMSEFADEMGNGKIPDETQKSIDDLNKKEHSPDSMTMVEYVEMIDGVNHAEFFQKDSGMVIGLKFDFSNPEILNEALNRIEHFKELRSDSNATLQSYEYYKFYGNKLIIKEPLPDSEIDEDEFKAKMTSMLLNGFSLKWIFTFNGRKIKNVECDFEYEVENKNKVLILADSDALKDRQDRKAEKIAAIEFK